MSRRSRHVASAVSLVVGLALAACGQVGSGAAPPAPTADTDAADAADGSPEPADANDAMASADGDARAADAGTDAAADEPDADAAPDLGLDAAEPPGLDIRAVSPERGPSAGGTALLILGEGFDPTSDVYVGGALCEAIDVVDETKITCRTPPSPPGRVAIKVVAGSAEASLADAFEYLPVLRIDAVDPDHGPTDGGMPAVVLGEGFSPDTQVSFGGRTAIDIEWIDSATLRVLTPPGAPGPAAVLASDPLGLDRVEGAFEYVQPPRVDRVIPGAGPAAGGTTVELEGAGLGATDTHVSFGLVEAELVEAQPDRLVVVAPPGPAGQAVDVNVSAGPGGDYAARAAFVYYDPAAVTPPALLQVAPARGPTPGGTRVIVSGVGLSGTTEVRFGSRTAELDAVHDDWLDIASPAAPAAGVVDVAVATSSGWRVSPGAFEYLEPVVIDAVAPERGDVAGGTALRISGSGFTPGSRVRVGPLWAGDAQLAGDGTIQATAPPGAPGPADVVVQTPEGAAGVAAGGFTYTTDLVVHGIDPPRGALAGGTRVVVRGRGLLQPVQVRFGDQDAARIEWLDPSAVAAYTPPSEVEAYVDVTVLAGGAGDWVAAPERFLYYDPQSPAGGVWGEAVDGAVNVTVVSDHGSLLDHAFVMLGVRDQPLYEGTTDANGQVTLSGPDLAGPQTVSASRPGYSASVIYDVQSDNVTLALRCAHDGACAADSDCRLGLQCLDGLCVDPPCAGQGGSGTPTPHAVITGRLDGLAKIGDPGPHERLLAAVFTSQEGPWPVSTVRPTSQNVLLDDGVYTLQSRVGSLAVVAVCGIYNDDAQTFRPIKMAIRRDLFLAADQTATADLSCDIWLDQTLTVKATASPLDPDGPTEYRHTPYLDLGGEGFFGGLVVLEGTDEVLSSSGFAPLDGPLADASYTIQGGAFTGGSWPYTLAMLEGVRAVDDVIAMPPFVAVAHLTTPVPSTTEPLSSGFLEWRTSSTRWPDVWLLQIRDFGGTTWWDAVVPGDATRINLPTWPSTSPVGLFPSGPMLVVFRGLDAPTFDFGDFDDSDLSSSTLDSFSLSAFTIVNP